jgi:hypothetical protein
LAELADSRIIDACCAVVYFTLDTLIPVDRLFYFLDLSVIAFLANSTVLFVGVVVLELHFNATVKRYLDDLGTWTHSEPSGYDEAISICWTQAVTAASGAWLARRLLEI